MLQPSHMPSVDVQRYSALYEALRDGKRAEGFAIVKMSVNTIAGVKIIPDKALGQFYRAPVISATAKPGQFTISFVLDDGRAFRVHPKALSFFTFRIF